jgi:high mobility group protein B2
MSSSSSSKKPTVQSQIDALEQRIAAQDQRIAALEAAAVPAAPAAEAPAKGKGKRAAKPKKEKNPDAPKRALSGYQIFGQAERAKALPEKLDFATISARWAALTKEQKDSYKPAAADAAADAEATASEAE